MAISTTSASSASSKISPMKLTLLRLVVTALIVGTLVACSTPPAPSPSALGTCRPPPHGALALPGDRSAAAALSQPKSRWTPVRWAELPGFTEDALHEAWNAWIKSCERPVAPFTALCSEVRQLSIASGDEQRAWMMARLQPYRVETTDGNPDGLLTAYYEP